MLCLLMYIYSGTPVIAPRNGYIVDIRQKHKQHGPNLKFEHKCNYLTILFDDGTQCDLVHLRTNSVKVIRGEYVKEGQLLAYSGTTGFSGEPHVCMLFKSMFIYLY